MAAVIVRFKVNVRLQVFVYFVSMAQQVVPMSYKSDDIAFNDLTLNIGLRMWRFGVLL